MLKKLIKVNASDNVAVALVNLKAGDVVSFEGNNISILSDTKSKHKIALQKFESGDRIIMYGVLVGSANGTIEKGEVLTTENVKHQSEKVFGRTESFTWKAPDVEKWKNKTFMGYHREDGQVGTENVWLFFPLVFCENRNIETLKEVFEKELLKQKVNPHQMLLRSLVNNTGEETADVSTSTDVFDNIDVKFI
ncbi:MAG TPA: SAF domain-containing protein, partial [Mariniflexile sp.]|nr:SAF domain-containing protein [Mariniflexile sp.]